MDRVTRQLAKAGAALIVGAGMLLPGLAVAGSTAQTSTTAPSASQSNMQTSQSATTTAANQSAMQPKATTENVAKQVANMGYANEEVMNVQQALNKMGFKLRVDGLYGPKTRAAVRSFQSQHGLTANGKLDQATLAKLNIT